MDGLSSVYLTSSGAPETQISPELKAFARELVQQGMLCPDCGGIHRRACPRVRRKVMNADLIVIEVEYWPNGEWESGIIFPEDVYEPDDAEGSDGVPGSGADIPAPGTDVAQYIGGPRTPVTAGR